MKLPLFAVARAAHAAGVALRLPLAFVSAASMRMGTVGLAVSHRASLRAEGVNVWALVAGEEARGPGMRSFKGSEESKPVQISCLASLLGSRDAHETRLLLRCLESTVAKLG